MLNNLNSNPDYLILGSGLDSLSFAALMAKAGKKVTLLEADEFPDTNGENNTYHAGAYLFEGLHEGAVTSGFAVAELLEGLRL